MSSKIEVCWAKFAGHKIKRKFYGPQQILSVTDGRKILVNAIQENIPYMAARIGTSEGRVLFEYLKKQAGFQRDYSKCVKRQMCTNAGFFPTENKYLDRWADETLSLVKNLDMLGTMDFKGEEYIVRNLCPTATLLPVGGLGSTKNGWAYALEGKKVLVVNPFEDTIKSQYKRRTEIFPGTNALPEFELKTIKSVVSFAGEKDLRFANWFEARDSMIEAIEKEDFDVCLLGCGAYGFHLAAHVKEMKKIAVHMGGSLQTLFGIKGRRWDNDPYMRSMYNDAWVYPSENEKPKGYLSVEGGCYW